MSYKISLNHNVRENLHFKSHLHTHKDIYDFCQASISSQKNNLWIFNIFNTNKQQKNISRYINSPGPNTESNEILEGGWSFCCRVSLEFVRCFFRCAVAYCCIREQMNKTFAYIFYNFDFYFYLQPKIVMWFKNFIFLYSKIDTALDFTFSIFLDIFIFNQHLQHFMMKIYIYYWELFVVQFLFLSTR